MLCTWLGYGDLTDLVRCGLYAAQVGHTVVYGVSANREVWWHNAGAADLGYVPRESSEPFRKRIEQQPPLPAGHPALKYQGGSFVACGPYETL